MYHLTKNANVKCNETLAALHTRFLKEKEYLVNLTPKSLAHLRWSFGAFTRFAPNASIENGAITGLNEFVIAMREAGMKPTSVNSYIRGVNSFLTWLAENEFIKSPVRRIKLLRVGVPLPRTVGREDLARLIKFDPGTLPPSLHRVHVVLMVIIDTGLRANEVLTLRTENLDLDGMVMRVIGKGRRERLVPFSLELRRVLFRYLNRVPANGEFIFATRLGTPVSYRVMLLDYSRLCRRIGIVRPGGFHRLRHTFATAYMGRGGNQFHLKSILGHRDLTTTDIYVHASIDELRTAPSPSSLLRK